MKIKNIEIKNGLFLAPMAGVTDIAFRRLCKDFGVGLTETEMVSVKAIKHGNKKTLDMLRTFEGESPVAVQLFGHEPQDFVDVIKSGVLDKFDIIDINCGCPAPKIVKNGDGSALLKNLPRLVEIVSTCVKATDKPISVKIRKGFKNGDDVLIPLAKELERVGVSYITVHPRTTEQGYSGKADYDDIKKVVEAVSIPVVGNGDVVDKCTYEQMLKTGCAGVMIGRKTFGNPEIFLEVLGKTSTLSKKEIAKRHISYLEEYFDEHYAVNVVKRHAFKYVEEPNVVEKRKAVALAKSLDEIKKFFE